MQSTQPKPPADLQLAGSFLITMASPLIPALPLELRFLAALVGVVWFLYALHKRLNKQWANLLFSYLAFTILGGAIVGLALLSPYSPLRENTFSTETPAPGGDAQASVEVIAGSTAQVPYYSKEDRDNILRMLSKLSHVNNVELPKAVNDAREACRPWTRPENNQDGKFAADTIRKIEESNTELSRVEDKMRRELQKEFSLYWDISTKIIDRKTPEGTIPILQFRNSLTMIQRQLRTYIEIEKNLVSKPDPNLVEMMAPSVEAMHLSANAAEIWLSDNAVLLKQESDKFRAAK